MAKEGYGHRNGLQQPKKKGGGPLRKSAGSKREGDFYHRGYKKPKGKIEMQKRKKHNTNENADTRKEKREAHQGP